jgi:hypothetical protein
MLNRRDIYLRLIAKLKPAYTPEEIAEKYKVTVDAVNKQLDAGQKEEREHTDSDEEARCIASHHIYGTSLTYYPELAKLEDGLKKHLKKSSALEGELRTVQAICVRIRDVKGASIHKMRMALENKYHYKVIGESAPFEIYLKPNTLDPKFEVTYLSKELANWAIVTYFEYDIEVMETKEEPSGSNDTTGNSK